jgi:hypothetical protein
MVMAEVIFSEVALGTVTDWSFAHTNDNALEPARPGDTHEGPLSNVPVFPLPEESIALVPEPSSKFQ